jgi:N utilization substance protein A
LENEVPEIYHGMVEIRSIAREPGQRSKVAVAALQPGVDPVGACVGIRGVRIQAIVRELNDEKIDVIEWNSDPVVFIAKALSPARVAGVYLDEQAKGNKTATVVVPEDQLSLAIGRDGQNARLAAKLTSWKIDIKSLPEAAADALYKLQNDPAYAAIAETETESYAQVEMVLAKKAEGRPVTPEEYHFLTQFVDRVESGLIRQREAERRAEEERQRIARANVPAAAFEILLNKFEVSDRIYSVISAGDFLTVGDVMAQMELEPDSILALSGMGPKGMTELGEALATLRASLEAAEAAEKEALEAEEEPSAEEAVVDEALVDEAEAEAPQPEALEGEVVEDEALEPGTEEAVAADEAPAVEAEEAVTEAEPSVEEEAEPDTLEELFAMRPEALDFESFDDEEETSDSDQQEKQKKKQKKKRYIEVEYDPDQDVMLTRRKRKRDEADWEDEW